MNYVIEFEKGVYAADWTGDPGRTLEIENAALFEKRIDALRVLKKSLEEYPEREWKNPIVRTI